MISLSPVRRVILDEFASIQTQLSLSPMRESYSRSSVKSGSSGLVCPRVGELFRALKQENPNIKNLSLVRGSYSQITEFRAEKDQFVPRAGSYSKGA